MNSRISKPIECLICDAQPNAIFDEVDVAIVGSGYGAAIAASRLAGTGPRVVVLERGREFELGDFPVGVGDVPGHVRFHRSDSDDAIGYPDALFDIRLGGEVDVLVGNGLGGTSLINANVAIEPADAAFGAWPHEIRDDLASLRKNYADVKALLGVTKSRDATKTVALRKLARALNATFSPADVTVTFGPRALNKQGVEQSPCTMCGNCVTGCNVGAKNTLMMNALPLAHARGAELYTGVTVLSVKKNIPGSKYRWILRFRRTLEEKSPLRDEVFELAAHDVILAAGTLGSTEILKRSEAMHALELSGELGKRFSGNGDGLAFGYGQRERVNALGMPQQFVAAGKPEYDVGPTITGVVQKTDPATGRRLTIEEGVIPHSLRRIFGEIVTTGAYFHRLQDGTLPAWHADNDVRDPILTANGALDYSQTLLLMGDDGAAGTMTLREATAHAGTQDRARLVVEWPKAAKNPALEFADALLFPQDRAEGFDCGQYVPNPLWRALPPDASGVMSGAAPGGRTLTVHPLGGCAMGETAHTGVVDHKGEVFRPTSDKNGNAVHEGLFVLDGSIIPGALGVNPFLTISALSWRAAELLRKARKWQAPAQKLAPPAKESAAEVARSRQGAAKGDPIQIVLRERLCGTVESMPAWLRDALPDGEDKRWSKDPDRWLKDRGLILGIEMEVKNLESYLEKGTGQAITAIGKMWANPVNADFTKRSHLDHTPDEHLDSIEPLAKATGKAWLLAPEDVNVLRRAWRMLVALYTYHRRRKSFWRVIKEAWQQRHEQPAKPKISWLKGLMGLLNIAWQHGLYRQFRYELAFHEGGKPEGKLLFRLAGTKRLAYHIGERRMWDALMKLDFELTRPWRLPVKGSVNVDLSYLSSSGIPQVKVSPHLPGSVVELAGMGAFFARALLQTHFWEFGAPDYEKSPDPQPAPQEPLPLKVGNQVVNGTRKDYYAQISANDPRKLRLRLTRYAQEKKAKPALLIHGLAQGSLIYSTDTLEKNMAASLWEAGYDVWLVDYRLSNLLPKGNDPAQGEIPFEGWSMEEMGLYDIPNAVQEVYDATAQQKVHIFAHCVGATAVALGILEGKLRSSQVECVAFNAIHPWILVSAVNESRAKLGTFFRDLVGNDLMDPIPNREPTAAQVMADRIGFTLARYQEQGEEKSARRHARSVQSEFAESVCDRMTFLYGRMWKHANLDPRTHAAFPQLVGRAPGDVYRHLYYFAIRQRLTDREGQNIYLTEQKLKGWDIPTFFFHGEDSMVFNPQSATRSAARLDAILNADPALSPPRVPIGLLRVEGYGHMDVVFAETAHEKVYPTLKAFFARPRDQHGQGWSRSEDIHMLLIFGITAGPVLRAAWADNGTVSLRFWAETNDEATTLIQGVELSGNMTQVEQWEAEPAESRYRLLDAKLNDRNDVAFDMRAKALGRIIHMDEARTMTQLRDDPAMNHHAPAQDPAHPPRAPKYHYSRDLPWLKRLREAGGKQCEDMRFLVGSCRYPGTPFERDASDRVFAGMAKHVDGLGKRLPGVHMLFLIGDQIYSDATANILDTKQWRERFSGRYRGAFTSANAKDLLVRIPTHFAIDDHEIADNWSGEASGLPPEQAMQSARSFQSSGRDTHRLPTSPTEGRALWYSLAHAAEHCCPAFVMDTRSERHLRSQDKYDAQFVSPGQLDALKAWLRTANVERPDEPKFIFCGIGFAPVSRECFDYPQAWRSNDGWFGYPEALAEVARIIADEQIPHVVFVGGDLHLSSVSRLTFTTARRSIAAWHIVASGLYAPMPFANAQPRDYAWNESVAVTIGRTDPVEVEMESGLLYAGEPHCLRVDAVNEKSRWTLGIWVVGADGTPLDPLRGAPRDVDTTDQGWVVDFGKPMTPSVAPKRIAAPATRC